MNHLKIVHASQGPIRKYEDLKRKLYFCNAHIYFNKQCAKKQLVPSYARIKVPNTSPAAKFTLKKVHRLRVADEIKHPYMKKQQLNHQVYQLHLLLANSWGNSWPYIQRSIEEKLEKALCQKYRQLDYKLEKLTQSQIKKPQRTPLFLP